MCHYKIYISLHITNLFIHHIYILKNLTKIGKTDLEKHIKLRIIK